MLSRAVFGELFPLLIWNVLEGILDNLPRRFLNRLVSVLRDGLDFMEHHTSDPVLLVIRNHLNVARTFFNTEEDWKPRPKPPVQIAVGRGGIGSFTMMLPASNEF